MPRSKRFDHLEKRKLVWPPRFSKEALEEGSREREEQLKRTAPSVPVAFPVDKDDQ